MTKKLLSVLCAGALCFSMAACSNTNPPPPANQSGSSAEPPPSAASTPEYPTKAINVIVPYQAGSQMDLVTRAFAGNMEKILGVPLAVENVVGADGVTGHISLSNASADGYTIGCVSASPLCVSPYIQEGIPYDYESFEYIGMYQPYMHGIAVKADSPAKNLDELIELAKTEDLVIGYAGTVNLCNIYKLMKLGDVDMSHITIVPYNSNEVIPALAGGFLDAAVHSNSTIGPMAESGDVRLLAPLGEDRWKCAPDVLSSVEQGYDMYSFGGLSLAAPDGTPQEIVDILRDAFEQATQVQEYSDMLIAQGYSPYFLVGDDCYERVKSDAESAKATLIELDMAIVTG